MTHMPWRCLMYHDVLPATDAAGGGPERFAVPVESFEIMLDAIRSTGRIGCSVADAFVLDQPRVAISFDDGTKSQFEYAVPALLSRGMTATFFVTTDLIGRPGFMDWPELREISSLGMSVQSHSKSHPFLSELNGPELNVELCESKSLLDERLGQNTDQISFPGGDAPRRHLLPMLAECGYRVVAGSRWGMNRGDRGLEHGRPLYRCTMRGAVTPSEARYILGRATRLSARVISRELVLNSLRAAVGPGRYARWRRRFLDAMRLERLAKEN